MAVASDTYIARTLACVGWNVTIAPAAGRAQRATRSCPISKPRRDAVDRVLLSSEPFMFRQRHAAELRDLLEHARLT